MNHNQRAEFRTTGAFGEELAHPFEHRSTVLSADGHIAHRPPTSTSAKYNNPPRLANDNRIENGNAAGSNIIEAQHRTNLYFEKMRNGRDRLKTFTDGKWPLNGISPVELAEAGFFYLFSGKANDRVQCAFCRGIISNWSPNDKPINEHLKHYSSCPFIGGYDVKNVPIEDDPIRGRRRLIPSFDVCGNHNFGDLLPSSPNDDSSDEEYNSGSDENVHELQFAEGQQETPARYEPVSQDQSEITMREEGPMHPEYASIDFRRSSYKNFPRNCPVKPNELAEAGFFYTGMEDCVRCFYCGGGLCSWVAGDIPWPEHRRLYPSCQFMKLNLAEQPSSSEGSSDDEMTVTEENDTDSIVDEWLKSDMVMRITDEKQFSRTVIRNVLRHRCLTVRKPFESYEQLLTAVTSAADDPLNQPSSQLMSTESDEEYNSGLESIPSSQESVLSTSPSSDEDNERVSRITCKVCLDKEIGVLFLPCGHLVACVQCGPGLSTCPLCRTKIVKTHRTFLA